MRRVVVVGSSGAGKTTLAKALAQRLGVPHVELDALYWQPNWSPAAPEQFQASVRSATSHPGWTCDGNYNSVRHDVWMRADTIIWLDYPMSTVFRRVFVRTLRRRFRKERLWNNNRERLWVQFFSRDSLLLWVINTWRRRRRSYPKLLASGAYDHARIYRFRTPAQTRRWLEALDGRATSASA